MLFWRKSRTAFRKKILFLIKVDFRTENLKFDITTIIAKFQSEFCGSVGRHKNYKTIRKKLNSGWEGLDTPSPFFIGSRESIENRRKS